MARKKAEPLIEELDAPAATELDIQERRSFPRTCLEVPVHLTVVPCGRSDTSFSGHLAGMTRDVSRGGCAIITDTEVAERARCVARFPLSTGRIQPDTVWAEVRRAIPQDDGVLLGLEFDTPLDALRIAPGPESEETHREPRTVLVVDDQAGVRGLLARYLGERGFVVECAADGEEAFRMLSQDPPDVLLLDLYLPRLNGHDLLRRMRELEIPVGLIFTMSGYADTSDAKECLRLGAVDHLLKPIDPEHLHRSIVLRLGTRPA